MRQIVSGVARPHTRNGFTLIEMLVVLGIIAVLVSLAMVVGSKVTQAGRERTTSNVIRVLDESRSSWELNADQSLPDRLVLTDTKDQRWEFPLIDARLKIDIDAKAFDTSPWPSVVYYTALVMQDASIKPIFQELDPIFAKPTTAPLPDDKGDSQKWYKRGLDIRDAWGRSMRLVHPAFHGGYGDYWDPTSKSMQKRDVLEMDIRQGKFIQRGVKFSRSWRPFDAGAADRRATWVGDADEGMCVGNTPYFYSAGAEGDPGNRTSNVYSTRPRFPVETADFK